MWCGISQAQLLRGDEQLDRSLGCWLIWSYRNQVWGASWLEKRPDKLRVGQVPNPCTLLLLRGEPHAGCERIWMSYVNSASQKELSPYNWCPHCQYARDVWNRWPASSSSSTCLFPHNQEPTEHPCHKASAWPSHMGIGECFIFLLFFKPLTLSCLVSIPRFQRMNH